MNDSLGGCATHKTTQHVQAWCNKKAKGTGQKCQKPWGNQGFAAERTGFEQIASSLGNLGFENGATQNPTRAEIATQFMVAITKPNVPPTFTRSSTHYSLIYSFTNFGLLVHLLDHAKTPGKLLGSVSKLTRRASKRSSIPRKSEKPLAGAARYTYSSKLRNRA